MNNEKALNAKLEILYLRQQIEELQGIIDNNISVYDIKNPTKVEVDLDKVECSIEVNHYVGHILKYKTVKISLHTKNSIPGKHVFNRIMEG